MAPARGLLEQSLAVHREAGDGLGIAQSLGSLGMMTTALGDDRSARAQVAEAVTMLRELGDRRTIAEALRTLARIACMQDGPLHAARIWGGAERLREEINASIPPNDRPDYEGQIAAARAAVADDAAFNRAWREGHAMTLEQTIECALAEPGA